MKHFFDTGIIFSLMYDEYEKDLKSEIWGVHKHMGLSISEIYEMPRSDRKFYIKLHNKSVEEETARD